MTPYRPLLVLILLLVGSLALSEERALIIGNNTYQSPSWPTLQNAVNDAVDMKAMLASLGFTVTLQTDANLAELNRTIEEFIATIEPEDTVIFYYAGHGGALGTHSAEPLLVPTDARGDGSINDLRNESYPLSRLVNLLDASPALLKMLFLDMCREELDTMLGARAAGNQPLGPGSVRSFVPRPATDASDSRARGTIISYSTSAGHIAYDQSPNGRNGAYTAALLEALQQSELNLDQTFRFVRQRVSETTSTGTHPYTRGPQIPTEENFLYGDDYFFHNVDSRIVASGDARKLVELARQGGTIRVEPGTYRLTSTLELHGDATILGDGSARTFIVSGEQGSVIRYLGSGTLELEGVSLVHEGSASSNVLQVAGGTVTIRDSRFSGGIRDEADDLGGAGLVLAGTARATVTASTFEANQGHGIVVTDRAVADLRGNILSNNALSGIYYTGDSTGTAAGNTSEHNGQDGIRVAGTAAPELLGNTLRDNAHNGIAYLDRSAGTAERNTSDRNGRNGVILVDQAAPTLGGNTIRSSGHNGIAYAHDSAGTAQGNHIEGSDRHGIRVFGRAAPRLLGNTVRDNAQSGISYADDAAGSAEGNTSEGNEIDGIRVAGRAAPILLDNVLRDNVRSGIAYAGNATGTAEGNTSQGNGRNGIVVAGQAAPDLRNNVLRANGSNGIAYAGNATGSAEGNTSQGNGMDDRISVEPPASPQLHGNTPR